MAGSYPDVPGYRFAYDIDGTICTVSSITGGTISTVTASDLRTLNQDQSPASAGGGSVYRVDLRNYSGGSTGLYLTFLFPEPRNITGYLFMVFNENPPGGRVLQTSADSTNSQDGTWTTRANPYTFINSNTSPLSPGYRTVNQVDWPAITGIKLAVNNVLTAVHLYGSVPNSESTDRLRIIDANNDDISAQLDFGNIAQRASVTKQFMVSNNSSTQVANNITVSLDTISNASPSLIGQYQISTDNTAFANAVNIGSLAPGATTAPLYLRMNPAASAQLGPWTARIIAHPVSWS